MSNIEQLPEHEAQYDEVVLLRCPRQGCGKDVMLYSWSELEPGTDHQCECGYRWRIKHRSHYPAIAALLAGKP